MYENIVRRARYADADPHILKATMRDVLRTLDGALAADPDAVDAYLLRGRILVEMFALPDARDAFGCVLERTGGMHFEAAYERAKCDFAMWVMSGGTQFGPHPLGRYGLHPPPDSSGEAVRLRQDLEKDLSVAFHASETGWERETLVLMAMAEIARGTPEGAVPLATRLLAGDPLNVDAMILRAVAFLMLARCAEAVEDAREAAQLQPTNFLAHAMLLLGALGSDQPQIAVDAGEVALCWNPDQPTVRTYHVRAAVGRSQRRGAGPSGGSGTAESDGGDPAASGGRAVRGRAPR
jgi:tetratricopeptide (TPR) repeat protein